MALKSMLPAGNSLDAETWERRHRGIRVLLFAQAAALLVFGIVRGFDTGHVAAEISLVAAAGLVSGWRRLRRSGRSAVATLGLVTCSALLVHLSGGTIEAHFHFFVMVVVIATYQDWTPFLLAIAYVAVHHGLVGAVNPQSVYNHPAAWRHPWTWAGIHAFFVLGISVACLVYWKVNEASRLHATKTASMLTATLDSTADGILVVDPQGRITTYNARFAEMWRIPESILATESDDAAIAFVLSQLKDPDAFVAKVEELYGDPEAQSFDVLEFADGRTFERYSMPQRMGGVPTGRVWSFRDVTDRVRLDELKNVFLSAVSHELRTPLTAVLGYATTLQNHGAKLSASERRDLLARMVGSAQKLSRLINDTLDLDRLRRGLAQPVRVPTDVTMLVRRIVASWDATAARPITVAGDRLVVAVDAPKVERIVENLVINSMRHTPPGTPMWVRVESDGRGVVLVVEDAGPGVPDELKERIFEPFRQGDVTAHSPGVGIGLALVAQFAALHGGRAWVEDRPGGGASFRVAIPDAA